MYLIETPQSIVDKGHSNLTALTPGMHGYSMLRPALNNDYFHGIYDQVVARAYPQIEHTDNLNRSRQPSSV